MSHSVRLTANDYSSATVDELIDRVAKATLVELYLDQELCADSVRDAVFLGSLAKSAAELKVTFPHGQAKRDVAESLDRGLLGTAIWGTERRANITLTVTGELVRREITDASRSIYSGSTSTFSARDPEEFQTALAERLRAANINLPRAAFGTLTGIGFEINSNAEEYGCLKFDGSEDEVGYRHFYVAVREKLGSSLTLATPYLESYGKAFEGAHPWLELIVTDVGVGLTYPSFYLMATAADRSERSVYDATIWEERQRLKLVLDKYQSTKGRFGRRINNHTAVGEGTQIVRFQVASVRGFSGVRTGRSAAVWSHASATLTATQLREMQGFEVLEDVQQPFFGTVWQVLIPLTNQYRLL